MAWAKPNTSAGRLWRVGPSAAVNGGRAVLLDVGRGAAPRPRVSVAGAVIAPAPVRKVELSPFPEGRMFNLKCPGVA